MPRETITGELTHELGVGTFLFSVGEYDMGGSLLGLCPAEESREFPGEKGWGGEVSYK